MRFIKCLIKSLATNDSSQGTSWGAERGSREDLAREKEMQMGPEGRSWGRPVENPEVENSGLGEARTGGLSPSSPLRVQAVILGTLGPHRSRDFCVPWSGCSPSMEGWEGKGKLQPGYQRW